MEVIKMFCKNCGEELKENAVFCHLCGCETQDSTEPKKSPKVWDVFSKVGYIGGLICFIVSFLPFYGFIASCISPNFIVLSALGKKSTNLFYSHRASKGLKFSIASAIIGVVTYILFFVIIFLLAD